jgi:hypothetical protein
VVVSAINPDSIHNVGLDGIIKDDIEKYNEPRPVTFSLTKYPVVDYLLNPPSTNDVLPDNGFVPTSSREIPRDVLTSR